MISFEEVFCSELPSPSNVFTAASSSSCGGRNKTAYKFASERHSLKLKKGGVEVGGSSSTNNNNSNRDENDKCTTSSSSSSSRREYSLLAERLSFHEQGVKQQQQEQQQVSTQKNSEDYWQSPTDSTFTCLAHSSLEFNDDSVISSIQVFAITNEEINKKSSCLSSHDNEEAASATTTAAVATISSLETYSSGHGDKEKVMQSSNNNINNNASEMIDKRHNIQDYHGTTATEATSSSSASSMYSLMIKCHGFFDKQKGDKNQTYIERIRIDFRPITVHLAQLQTSLRNNSSTLSRGLEDEDDGGGDNDVGSSSLVIIGVFVAGNDNKLHFYTTTVQALVTKQCQIGESESSAATATTTSFRPSFCFEKIDPSNIIISSCAASEYDHNISSEDPLSFTTPIMSIDTYMSDEGIDQMDILSSSSSSSAATTKATSTKNKNINRLAIACYDGMVRILTYTMNSFPSVDDDFNISIVTLQYSSFFVDGPVATLHFGKVNNFRNTHREEESEEEGLQRLESNNGDLLLLLVGSLCGLAFLFYEVPFPSAAQEYPSFDGPVIVVDGLYDADNKEGCEDCVTSVHVICHDVTMLVVGTQGGRLIMFQQVPLRSTNDKDEINEKGILTAEVTEDKTREKLQLVEKREMLKKNEVHDLSSENFAHDEFLIDGNDNFDGDRGLGGEDYAKVELADEGATTHVAAKIGNLHVIQAKTEDFEQARTDGLCTAFQLQSSVDNNSVRKMHHYEFLFEKKLPYPIQGIGSSVCDRNGDLECFIATTQTVHVFRVLSMLMVEAAAATLERKFLSAIKTSDI